MANLAADILGGIFSFFVLLGFIGAFILNPASYFIGAPLVDALLLVGAILCFADGLLASRYHMFIYCVILLVLLVLNLLLQGGGM